MIVPEHLFPTTKAQFALYEDYRPRDYGKPKEVALLPSRWTKLRYHKIQQAFLHSTARFNVVPAGRRSGKTEIAKRRLVKKAMLEHQFEEAYFLACAPTHGQAQRIFWRDLKRLVPKIYIKDKSESYMRIELINSSIIQIFGLDVPERVEGIPVRHAVLDEYGNMKPEVWSEHLRAALSDQKGTVDFTGVPEGRNHYFDLYTAAPHLDDWATFHWPSRDILPPDEIEAARRDLDPLVFDQEYNASFVVFQGLAYYSFRREDHVRNNLVYRKDLPLIFCFDFNREPGVAVICQEYEKFTAVIGEVYIRANSTTPRVCEQLNRDWEHHTGRVYVYGDATGGQRTSSSTEGSDWDLVRANLAFQGQTIFRVGESNPTERARVNAVNSRLKNAAHERKLRISANCKHLIKDMEGVRTKDDGSGDIDKKRDKWLTHISDALGYFIEWEHPIVTRHVKVRTW